MFNGRVNITYILHVHDVSDVLQYMLLHTDIVLLFSILHVAATEVWLLYKSHVIKYCVSVSGGKYYIDLWTCVQAR
jgi:hypothetical protein